MQMQRERRTRAVAPMEQNGMDTGVASILSGPIKKFGAGNT